MALMMETSDRTIADTCVATNAGTRTMTTF